MGEVQKPEKSKSSSRQKVYTSKVKVEFVPKFLENAHACHGGNLSILQYVRAFKADPGFDLSSNFIVLLVLDSRHRNVLGTKACCLFIIIYLAMINSSRSDSVRETEASSYFELESTFLVMFRFKTFEAYKVVSRILS